MRGVRFGGGAINRLKWLVHVLMLQWLWSWFALISRLSDIHILCLVSLMMSSHLFAMNGSWLHVAMVVVLFCPHFSSLRYTLCLFPPWCPHISVFATTCGIYCGRTDSRSIFFPGENGGSSWNFWDLAIRERGYLEMKGEKENMPLVDRIVIVAQIYSTVCQLHLGFWNTTLVTWNLCGHKAYIDMYYCTL